MEFSEIGEFGFIERFRPLFESLNGAGTCGIGDDCAVMPFGDEDLLVTTDMLLENTHFLRAGISPYDLGWKTLAVNLSDVAAMGGTPVASFLSVGIPSGIGVEYMDEFMRGYRDLSSLYRVSLAGGDTTRATGENALLALNVAVVGRSPHGAAIMRGGARPGDAVCVTGTLGDSAAGLEMIIAAGGNITSSTRTAGFPGSAASLLEKHWRPRPRVEEALALAATGAVRSMMDISDGVASDLKHILKASGVSARVDIDALPLSAPLKEYAAATGTDAVAMALGGGEDYELLFTAGEKDAERIAAEAAVKITRIGTVTEGESGIVRWCRGGEEIKDDYMGFDHFGARRRNRK